MFMAPVAVTFFAETFFSGTLGAAVVEKLGVLSPFAADVRAAARCIERRWRHHGDVGGVGNLPLFFGYIGWSIVYNGVLVLAMMRLFQVRWRVAD